MSTIAEQFKNRSKENKLDFASFLGQLISFNNKLKLHHWHITGSFSYSIHMALDQALEGLSSILDSLVETSYALYGDLEIIIPETRNPENITDSCVKMYSYIEENRDIFKESFSQGILDNYQEEIQQLIYRLKRLQ